MLTLEDEDEDVGLLTCVRTLASAVGHLLKDNEGVIVELAPEEGSRDGKFLVVRNGDKLITIIKADDEPYRDGQMIWYHPEGRH